MEKEKRTGKRIWEPLGKEAKNNEGRGGKYNASKRFGKQTKNMGMELIKSSWKKSKAEMQQDA